ncbi:hypothetical protein Csa_008270 [Cucumis sativus]|uniref:Pentapeptide repeat n=1 Tax=Cucumis sativus TaxID=3659 RepID=A0A0A0KTZ5_CUCSA|nr:hypothetical protein Csa_008270 [Cucumis sativus]
MMNLGFQMESFLWVIMELMEWLCVMLCGNWKMKLLITILFFNLSFLCSLLLLLFFFFPINYGIIL